MRIVYDRVKKKFNKTLKISKLYYVNPKQAVGQLIVKFYDL